MPSDIPTLRLRNHRISSPMTGSPRKVVAWMGAMQAQDFPMAEWALGLRAKGSTRASVEAALDRGEIVRIHILRPTWHLVAAEDVRWMIDLTAPNIRRSLAGRHRQLGLTDAMKTRSRRVLEKSLAGGRHFTREELVLSFQKAGIDTGENRGWHLLLLAELDALICSGRARNGKQTVALMDERVPAAEPIGRDEALARLAERYYTSHGPAQEKDFVWWSGLSVRDARLALDMVKSKFVSETAGGRTFWFRGRLPAPRSPIVRLLPAFDEYIIGYADRSDVLGAQRLPRAVSANGVFRPTIIVNGRVAGLWSASIVKGSVMLKADPIAGLDRDSTAALKKEAARYERFRGTKVEPA